MVDVDARTLGEVIDGLETRYPGLRTRLVTDGHLRPGLRALVAGAPAKGDLRGPVGATDEIFFLRQIGGGA
jgi:hypothetical protein